MIYHLHDAVGSQRRIIGQTSHNPLKSSAATRVT